MKKMFLAAVAALVLAGGITFMACNKEESTVTTTKSNFAKSGEKPISIEEEIKQIIDNLNVLLKDNQNVVIATYSKGKDFELAFEKTKFFELYEKAIKEELGQEVAVNDIYIVDKKPLEKEYYPCIVVSTFDLNTSETSTMTTEIRKIVFDNGTASYFLPVTFSQGSGGSSSTTCISSGCKNEDGCIAEKGENGKPKGTCTKCIDATCTKISTASETPDTPKKEKNLWQNIGSFCGALIKALL